MLRKKQAAVDEDEESAKKMYPMLFGSEIRIRGKLYKYDQKRQPRESKADDKDKE